MATITGLTATRMLAIEAASIVDGEVVGDNLILERHDGTTIDAGSVRGEAGPTGPTGLAGGMIPGEIRMWPSSTLPDEGTYGKWVWANGAIYSEATYPMAAANIDTVWKTFAGLGSPGAGNFRVPDMRGLVAAGLDQMPGDGARANRMTRSEAIVLADTTGEETHILTVAEMPAHHHSGVASDDSYTTGGAGDPTVGVMGISDDTGGDDPHENVQPTVFIPYIVKLDD